jgi:type IV pilus assembly protein PilC
MGLRAGKVSAYFAGTMATTAAAKPQSNFKAAQALAKQKAFEKKAKTYKLDMAELSIFTGQLASLLQAGLPLVSCLEALQDQTEDQVFRVVIRDVRNDISTGTSFSAAVKKFP